ncbi:MAG: DnaA/Hda family protein, partial [Caldimonas sp.]
MRADLWQRGCERLASELPDQQFNTWIRPLPDADVSDQGDATVVTVRVPNRFKLDWIRNQYAGRIETVLTEIAGKPVRLDVTLAQRDGTPGSGSPNGHRPGGAGAESGAMERSTGSGSGHRDDVPGNGPGPGPAAVLSRTGPVTLGPLPSRSRLNPALTFDTLVPGRANQMARTAALHVAGSPGQMYNPLFIYGGVGLGKTHLIHAVGNALLADRSDARILYLHAEQFITDVVKNYQRKTFDELKAKYHSLDLLLIDDVQFFAGKERTQEEFFNAFEALLAKRAH